MKALILATTLAALSFTANAEETKQSQCAEIADFAGNIMTLRQLGKPMADTFKLLGDKEPARTMIIQAYETPKFSGEKYKKEHIDKFKDDWFLACIKM